MDTNLNPIISTITITRNRGDFIAKALESAQKQGFSGWELIVLDDDSNDDTEAIVEAFRAKDGRIRYYKNSPLLGIAKNRNLGVSLAKGEYIAVLDSDDFWLDENKLQKQYDFLKQNPDYVIIGSNLKIVDPEGALIKDTTFALEDAEIRDKILKNNQIGHSSVLMKKDVIIKAGGYIGEYSEDLNLFLRMGVFGKMKNFSETTTAYTRHPGANSQKRKFQMAWNHFKIVFSNFRKYPNWFSAIFWAKLRIIKSLI